MFENFGLEISKIFKDAELIRYDLRHPYVGSEHLLLSILKNNNDVTNVLKKHGVSYSNFKKELLRIVGSASKSYQVNLYTPLLKRVIENAVEDAKEDNNGVVTIRHIMISMLEEGEGIGLRILLLLDVDLEKLYNELKNKVNISENFNIDNAIILNDTVDMNEKVICRDKEINRIIETLLRHKKNNPILVGKAGVGKTAIVEELARMINSNKVPSELYNCKIVMLEMGSLVAGTKYRGEFEEKLTKIIEKSISNNHVILFIDEIHSMVNAGAAEGAISAADILKPYLARGNLKVIGATTIDEYNKYFLKDKALNRRFEKIFIEEPTILETKEILYNVKKEYEKYHEVIITKENIDDIVDTANKYIYDKCNPDKSIELLDTICANVKMNTINDSVDNDVNKLDEIIKLKNDSVKNKDYSQAMKYKIEENNLKANIKNNNKISKNIISHEEILKVIEEKTMIPLIDNGKKYLEISDDLLKNIYGQKQALIDIIDYLQFKSKNVKSLLLIGPSGVGKTECVKRIGKYMNFIKIDMNDFVSESSVSKLVGVNGGYMGYDNSYIFQEIREKPYTLILLDEIEKANKKVLNLFLNILDEGKIIDSHNEEINFSNCVIIATGNIMPKKNLGFGKNSFNYDSYLPKELISRFDKIINFGYLKKEDIYNYIKDSTSFNEEEINEIIEKSEYNKYGLRNIKNLIREKNCKQLN